MMNDQSMMGDPGAAQQQVQAQAMQPPAPPAPPPAEQTPADEQANYMDWALDQANLAKGLVDKKDKDGNMLLDVIGEAVMEGYKIDEKSREPWMKKNKKWLELALLIAEDKSWPWPKAANIKYPLVATAAMQFSARAYPALVPSDGSVVKARVAPKDMDGQMSEAAARVSRHMSYQVMERIPKWEENMDKLLMTMAISGIAFKKTFHDATKEVHRSHLVYPENFCINYWARDVESAYRKTEILYYTQNEVKEKQLNDEEFLDMELPQPGTHDNKIKEPVASDNKEGSPDKSTPHLFLACHTFWDLDDDGYEEPYIITVHKETRKVVRITARWDSDGVKKNGKGKIMCITPVEYFTAFPFIPNPDGSIYALGFGSLLGSLNNASNSIINMLLDAGTMNNLQSGFIGRNLRMKEGQVQLRPNEWKVVNASGEDLQKSIYPLPTKEPSAVLMSLLQMLITSGNQLASIAEIFVGKMPGQNTPATTTQETVQQGMAVFTAVYKRVYRSLEEEFFKIFRLNRITPGILQEESMLAGIQIADSDYDGTKKFIIPGGDPSGDTQTQKQQKLQQVGQLLQLGTIDGMEYTSRVLEGLDIPNADKLKSQPQPPPPDPKMQTEQLKQQGEQLKQQGMQQKFDLEAQAQQQEIAAKERLLQIEVAHKALEANHQRQMAALEQHSTKVASMMDMVQKLVDMHHEAQAGQLKIQQQDAQGEAEMARAEKLHNQKMKLAAKAAAAKPKAKAK